MNPRLNKVYECLEAEGLDALLVTKEANVSYLSGFKGRDSSLLISNKENFFITDFRYLEEVKRELSGFKIEAVNGSFFKLLANLVKRAKIKKLGFESKWLSYKEYEEIKRKLTNSGFIPTWQIIESLREIKDAEEIKFIRKAIEITAKTLKYLNTIIRPGLKEIELAGELERFIRLQGAQKSSFEIIIASGSRSSMPHAVASRKIIDPDESILIDIGVEFKGYTSDLTRMVFLDKISPYIKKTYDIVLRAQEAAIEKIKPGIKICDIDTTARDYIVEKKFGKFFGHNLGHGIGKEVHEDPSISFKNKGRLKAGMVFTIEPAIYIPDKFGIRLEDIVLVTNKGCEVLSNDLDKRI
jgi:Xaa-Pro aminopeptidase